MHRHGLLLLLAPLAAAQNLVRTDSDIGLAVSNWVSFPDVAITSYGNITQWDTSQVTDMYGLFSGKTTFNDVRCLALPR